MTEDPAYIRVVSLHLSRTLDEIGLNTLTVKRRRRTVLNCEQIQNVYFNLTGKERSAYHFGSQTEGTTTPGLDSDLDTLICHHDYNVIQDWVEWGRDKNNLLMVQGNTAPGYCCLQVLRSDIPMAGEEVPSEHCTYDSRGRVVLKNTWLHRSTVKGWSFIRNGPARSDIGRPGFMDGDYVRAIECSSWPRQAEEFIRRHRRHGWPSHSLVQQSVKHGVFLVPVGYKLSPSENLEWRISTSLAERCLMFSLNIVHIKCYVVLKTLVKTFVEPHVRKCISSYHCKTALFYCTENTEPGFWRDDNLLQCVALCLSTLLAWVTNGFCPQFFMSKANLFSGKVTAQNKGKLKSVLTDLIKSNGRALLLIGIDNLGNKLLANLSSKPSVIPVLDSRSSMMLSGTFEGFMHGYINAWVKEFPLKDKNTKTSTVIRSVHQKMEILKYLIGESNKDKRYAVQTVNEFLSCWLGSLLASVSLSRKMRIPRESMQLLLIGAKSDVASMLKLASVLYCNGDLLKVETMLQRLEEHFCRNEIQPVCECYDKYSKMSDTFAHMMYALRGKKVGAKLFAHCVRFSLQEIHCAPPALQIELFRSVGDDIQYRHPFEDDWMFLASVDCLPYLYYLQYMTYRQLGKRHLQRLSILNLIREDANLRHHSRYGFGHIETDWNLLGQCMELEQDPEAAMACYKTSLKIRSRNNAANWHVAILCYRLIKDRCAPI